MDQEIVFSAGDLVFDRVYKVLGRIEGTYMPGITRRIGLTLLDGPSHYSSDRSLAYVTSKPATMLDFAQRRERFDRSWTVMSHRVGISSSAALRNAWHVLVSWMSNVPQEIEWLPQTIICGTNPSNLSYATNATYADIEAGRREIGFGRFLSAMAHKFDLALDDKQIALLATLWGQIPHDAQRYTFELVTGDELVDAYQSGHSSCMTGNPNLLQLYQLHPNRIRLLKIFDNEHYMGRALVWQTDQGRIFMDRVYPSDEGAHIQAAIDYAQAQGWDWLKRQSFDQHPISGAVYTFTVEHRPRMWPYLDTFREVCQDHDSAQCLLTHSRTLPTPYAYGSWFVARSTIGVLYADGFIHHPGAQNGPDDDNEENDDNDDYYEQDDANDDDNNGENYEEEEDESPVQYLEPGPVLSEEPTLESRIALLQHRAMDLAVNVLIARQSGSVLLLDQYQQDLAQTHETLRELLAQQQYAAQLAELDSHIDALQQRVYELSLAGISDPHNDTLIQELREQTWQLNAARERRSALAQQQYHVPAGQVEPAH